ncbi:ABC transporter permease [Mobilicoccus massiliensis]|uniref:ABC transporter permease n=1 Tax=Mobilicoccus massiliensis TaxID=1522310 RepID=UPI0005905388|nr:ABC-2 family transporter protein [Mobilicoccus massiliensis]
MRVFVVLVVAGFRRFTAYRLAALAGVVANVTFGYIRGAVLLAIAGAASVAASGYSADSLMTYNWLTQASIGALAIWGTNEITERVRTGDIAVDLARPLDLMTTYLAQDLGRAGAAAVLRGLPTLAVGALTVGLALPAAPSSWILGVAAAVTGVVVSFLSRFLLQLTSFWIVETRGLQTLYMVASGFFSGLVFPLALMPSWLQTLAALTPFPAMLQLPVDVLSGRVTGVDAWNHLGVQMLWLAGLTVAGRLMLAAGTRRLVVQGG